MIFFMIMNSYVLHFKTYEFRYEFIDMNSCIWKISWNHIWNLGYQGSRWLWALRLEIKLESQLQLSLGSGSESQPADHATRMISRQTDTLALLPGFSRSLGSATSNAANKSAMLNAEWTIAARRAVLRLAQMKYRCFVSEWCKQNAIFSGTSHQNRAYLDNIWTNRWYIVDFQQGHCSSKVTDENFKITLQTLQVLTPNFHSDSVSALC